MKKFIACLILTTLSLSSFAGHGGQANRVEHMAIQLQLSDTQKTQVETIFNNSTRQREALREAMQKLRQSTNDDIRAILTPEQQQKFDQMKQQKKSKHGHKKGNKDHKQGRGKTSTN